MFQFSHDLEIALHKDLELHAADPNKIAAAYNCLDLVRSALIKLRQHMRANPFTDQAEEIRYFKMVAPRFYSQYFYYSKKRQIELTKQFGDRERVEPMILHELDVIFNFYKRHSDFCNYYDQSDSPVYDSIFIRNSKENARLDDVEIIMDADFCVGCYWAAQLLANQLLCVYLKEELHLLRNPAAPKSAVPVPEPELIWTGSDTDLVELIYGILEMGSFNNGNATIKQVVAFCTKHWGVDLKHAYMKWQDIERRKKSPTQYISTMDKRLRTRIAEKP